MPRDTQSRVAKLQEQCAALAGVIASVRPVYATSTDTQKALIETMIGAAIWYITKPPDAWTGYMSTGVLKAFLPDSDKTKPKYSEEHVYPRKVAARMLLNDGTLDAETMATVFRAKYGRLHYITSEENRSVQPHQRADVFTTPDAAYAKAGITLVEVARQDMPRIKKRDRATIESYLSRVQINKDT